MGERGKPTMRGGQRSVLNGTGNHTSKPGPLPTFRTTYKRITSAGYAAQEGPASTARKKECFCAWFGPRIIESTLTPEPVPAWGRCSFIGDESILVLHRCPQNLGKGEGRSRDAPFFFAFFGERGSSDLRPE